MNVAALLKHKGRAVTTTAPTTSLIDISKKLAAKKIGAMVVVGTGGEVAGIISERDIIRAECVHSHLRQALHRGCVIHGPRHDAPPAAVHGIHQRLIDHLPVLPQIARVYARHGGCWVDVIARFEHAAGS